jgi:hypothetical protein
MIWRKAGVVSDVALEPAAALFIRALANGQALAEAAESLPPECLPEYLAELVLTDAFLAPQA